MTENTKPTEAPDDQEIAEFRALSEAGEGSPHPLEQLSDEGLEALVNGIFSRSDDDQKMIKTFGSHQNALMATQLAAWSSHAFQLPDDHLIKEVGFVDFVKLASDIALGELILRRSRTIDPVIVSEVVSDLLRTALGARGISRLAASAGVSRHDLNQASEAREFDTSLDPEASDI